MLYPKAGTRYFLAVHGTFKVSELERCSPISLYLSFSRFFDKFTFMSIAYLMYWYCNNLQKNKWMRLRCFYRDTPVPVRAILNRDTKMTSYGCTLSTSIRKCVIKHETLQYFYFEKGVRKV